MGGSSNANDDEFVEEVTTTIVLVGCTGSGKSSTGNSIIGQKVFKSMSRFGGVTNSCKLQTTRLPDGHRVNVIDTPGLFDSANSREHIEKEIVRCINMARDGIHAILIVVSLRGRFSEEQVAAVETLKHLFGTEIVDYMIVTLTGGDELEDDETLDNRLSSDSCPALTELLEKCENRVALFDNKTKDESKKAVQLHQLFRIISEMVEKNGKPYTHELFFELKKKEFEEQMQKEFEQMQLRVAQMVHEKLQERQVEIIKNLEENLGKAQLEDEIHNLQGQLEEAQRKIDRKWGCAVM